MQIIAKPAILIQLWESREIDFTELMKIVVDIHQKTLAIDGDMHADLKKLLLDNGSHQKDLWGANIYPMIDKFDRLEFTSFINIRPSQGNRGMEVKDAATRELMQKIVMHLLV